MSSRIRHFASAIVATLVLFAGNAAAAPASDSLASATNIEAVPFSDLTDTSGATTDAATEPKPSCIFSNGIETGDRSVWYRYTPAAMTDLRADTRGSSYDTVLVVWDGGPAGVQVGCNDDNFGVLQSGVDFTALAGHTYYFQIAFWRELDPTFDPPPVLSFQLGAPPPPFAASVTLDGVGHAAGATGVVEVTGSITCNRPGFVSAIIHVQQERGRIAAAAVFGSGFCGPQPARVVVRLVGANARFTPGQAVVTVAGNAFEDPFSSSPFYVQSNVRLQGTGPKQLALPPPPQP